MLRTFATVIASVAATFVFFFACSDDGGSPMDAAADAGTCNCPAAEPPLAGRLTIVTMSVPDQGGTPGTVGVGAQCPDNAELLGGGCNVTGPGANTLTLYASARPPAGPFGYSCRWNNPTGATVTIEAWASCLAPPQ